AAEQLFCRTISPPLPMDIRKQTKRQFAGLLANLCASSTNNQPIKGGKIVLDPSSPINCSGVTAKTVGELVQEVDQALMDLDGKNLNDPAVKAHDAAPTPLPHPLHHPTPPPTSPPCQTH